MPSFSEKINCLAKKSKILDMFAIFCANYLIFLMIAFLFIYALFVRNWQAFFYPILSGFFSAFIIARIIYFFYKEHRPAGLKHVNVLIPVPKNPSFPSSHAALVFGMSFYLFFYNVPLAVIFIICSCLVGLARVFCGVHWFHDILAGIFVGLISTLVLYNLMIYLK